MGPLAQTLLSGDSPTGHVSSATIAAMSLGEILVWGMGLVGIPSPPASVEVAYMTLATIAMSFLMQRLSQRGENNGKGNNDQAQKPQ